MPTTRALASAFAALAFSISASSAEMLPKQDAEDLADRYVKVATVLDKESHNVTAVIARDQISFEITQIENVSAEGRLLTIDYTDASTGDTMRMAVDATNILYFVEREQ